ncbi:unnamed protein product [Coccothraustes coccothraustes]
MASVACLASEVTLVLPVEEVCVLETCFPTKPCLAVRAKQAIKGDLEEPGQDLSPATISRQENEYWKVQQWVRTEEGQLGADWDVYLKSRETKVKQGNLEVEVLIYSNEPGLAWAKF